MKMRNAKGLGSLVVERREPETAIARVPRADVGEVVPCGHQARARLDLVELRGRHDRKCNTRHPGVLTQRRLVDYELKAQLPQLVEPDNSAPSSSESTHRFVS